MCGRATHGIYKTPLGNEQECRAMLEAARTYCGWIAPLMRAVSRPVHLLPGGTFTFR